jgi:hypothetical protein
MFNAEEGLDLLPNQMTQTEWRRFPVQYRTKS